MDPLFPVNFLFPQWSESFLWHGHLFDIPFLLTTGGAVRRNVYGRRPPRTFEVEGSKDVSFWGDLNWLADRGGLEHPGFFFDLRRPLPVRVQNMPVSPPRDGLRFFEH